MDGISAGASILALVAAAVQTSRTIYNVVSSIKSGSKDVLGLVSGASTLERVLHQLSTLIDSKSLFHHKQHVITLEQTVRGCASDLDGICTQLWKLRHDANAGSAKKAWRLIQVAVKKDEVQRMSRILQQHVSMLTLQVVVLSSRETTQQSQLLVQLTHALNESRSSQSVLEEHAPQGMLMQQDTSATLLAIRGKLNSLPSITTTCFGGTMSLMDEIEAQVESTSNKAEAPNHAINVVIEQHRLEGLSDSLQRLSEFAQQEAHNAHSTEAEDIVEDIDVLISSLLSHYEKECSASRKRKRSVLAEDIEAERALKQIKSMVNANQSVAINQTGHPRSNDFLQRNNSIERRIRTYQMPHGTASIFTKLVKGMGYDSNIADSYERTSGFSATVEYLPSGNLNYAKIVAHLEQHTGRFGSTTLYPALSVCPVIPHESEVFAAIKSGDPLQIEALFRDRKATPRDCDLNGRSLLGYACSHDKPEICKYLLEKGADGDAIEKADFGDGQYEYSPLLLHCGTHDPALECQRLLLASGADPSRATEDELGPFELALYKPILLNHIKYYAHDLIDTEERDSGGDTFLLRFMHRCIYNLWALRFLLDIGANVHARTLRGNTCLHLCFIKACREMSDFRDDDLQLLSCLSMLINAGANVRAVNWAGQSVSDLISCQGPQDSSQCDIGSFTMDAWSKVLKKHGFRPVDVMGNIALSHRVRFTEKYRAEHFMAIQAWEPSSMNPEIHELGMKACRNWEWSTF